MYFLHFFILNFAQYILFYTKTDKNGMISGEKSNKLAMAFFKKRCMIFIMIRVKMDDPLHACGE
ncbi:hypothetical protein DWZ56_18180 [Lachnotalea sp. AF33-28]|nr:hypothetical protein DWZ56_18180 [Lachnotalea sp. AF33-28]